MLWLRIFIFQCKACDFSEYLGFRGSRDWNMNTWFHSFFENSEEILCKFCWIPYGILCEILKSAVGLIWKNQKESGDYYECEMIWSLMDLLKWFLKSSSTYWLQWILVQNYRGSRETVKDYYAIIPKVLPQMPWIKSFRNSSSYFSRDSFWITFRAYFRVFSRNASTNSPYICPTILQGMLRKKWFFSIAQQLTAILGEAIPYFWRIVLLYALTAE